MKAREIRISAAMVSPGLTRRASNLILNTFGGYFRSDGQGGYIFADGQTIEESATSWLIGTSKDSATVRRFMAAFGVVYCGEGDQESVYFADDGHAYLVGKDGQIRDI